MPVSVLEKFESRQSSLGDSASVELAYIVSGTDDDIVAKGALLSATPIWYDGLVRQNLSIDPLGPGMWDGKVRYGRMEKQPETGESTYQFDTGGGTQHITQSIETMGAYSADDDPPDFGGAIGVTHDNVEGVDITIPVYQFSETHYLPAAVVTNAYKGLLFYLAGDSSYGWDCCADGGCCNYAGSPIDEILTGGPPTWSAYGRGPVGTSDWTLERQGAGPNYTWVLTNNCQAGCHPGAYTGTATWDGEGSKVFQMGNYPPLTVTKVNCP